MTVYVIGLSTVHNQEEMNRYRQGVPATLAQYGGRLAIRGLVTDVLEGDTHPNSVVIFEFDSADDARRWYTSPEYSAVRQHRHDSADSSVLLLSPPPR
jgi:uncharacterized protein (DUF1330 family)